jgi:hypothetical protein
LPERKLSMQIARILGPVPKSAAAYVALGFLLGAAWGSLAAAQGSVQPAYPPSLSLPAQTVDAFLQNPQSLIQQPGENAGRLAVQTRDLLASNPNTLEPMLNVLKVAPPSQQAAIASGIAMATRIYARTNPNFAAQIQTAAVSTGVPAAVAVSVAATNTSTATMAIKPPPTPLVALPTGSSTPAGGIADAQGVGFRPSTASGGINDQSGGGQGAAVTGGVDNSSSEQTTNAPTGGFAQSVSPIQ